MKELHLWVLVSTVEVHWSLSGPNGSLPPHLLVVLLQSSTLVLHSKDSEPLFWLCKATSVLCIVEGPREPSPLVMCGCCVVPGC
jgi:hypothetical protein